MDFIIYIVLLLIGGCFGGLMAGLLGVGGGIILSPIQYYLLQSIGVNPSIALPMSFATSLAVIFVTMIRGTREHYRNGNVEDRFLKQMMILGFIGAICGAFISTHIDVTLLSFLFGVLCIVAVLNMILIKYPDNDENISKSKLGHSLLGFAAGLLCGLLGVGGGVIMIPALTILLKYPTHKAIGTSSASIIATTLGGLIAYIILGLNVSNLPQFSIGYVNILQFIFLTITSTFVVKYVADLSVRIDARILKIFHIIIVGYIGLNMIGII